MGSHAENQVRAQCFTRWGLVSPLLTLVCQRAFLCCPVEQDTV